MTDAQATTRAETLMSCKAYPQGFSDVYTSNQTTQISSDALRSPQADSTPVGVEKVVEIELIEEPALLVIDEASCGAETSKANEARSIDTLRARTFGAQYRTEGLRLGDVLRRPQPRVEAVAAASSGEGQ